MFSLARRSFAVAKSASGNSCKYAAASSYSSFKRSVHSTGPTKSSATEEPAKEVSEQEAATKFLNSVPGSDKTYNFLIGTSAAAYLFSNEVIPLTPEIAYMLPFGILISLGFKHGGPLLNNITNKVEQEKAKFWNESKSKAEARLEEQIHEITGSGITDLVQITDDLFEHAAEVAKMEAEAFEHQQKVEYFTKAKQILDDWLRFETNERERVQKIIAAEVMAKVNEAVKDPKFQEKYLEQCIGDIEMALSK